MTDAFAQTKLLSCPHCRASLYKEENSLFCTGAKRHCFDIASSGYVNLSVSQKSGSGDSADAVRARSAFLRADYYKPAAEAIAKTLSAYLPKDSLVLDAGCGEGYYAQKLAENGLTVLGFDLSKSACERASKQARAAQLQDRCRFVVASLFALPICDNSADGIMSIFAPCAEKEFLRVLRPGGILLVAGAGKRHLFGLKEILYENPYFNTERNDLPSCLHQIEKYNLTFPITVYGQDAIQALFSMTPYYWRTSEKDKAKLFGIEQLTTEIDFELSIYRKETEL